MAIARSCASGCRASPSTTPIASPERSGAIATLVLDTATAACSAALLEDGRVLAAAHEVVGRGHAERLIPMVAELVAGRPRPTRILVDCGPGSFTGVRVGLAAARALALGWRAEAAGFSSLALLAAMAAAEAPVAVAIPGGHGELFVQRFAPAPLRPLDEIRSLRPEAAAETLGEPLIVGEAADAVVALRGWGEARMLLPDAREAWRLPASLAGLPPSPLYGRAPDAKVRA